MTYRSRGRWLAPLALVAAAIAIVTIVRPDGQEAAPRVADRTVTDRPARSPAGKGSAARRTTYTVRQGDVLSAIAQRTGVGVARLRDLNPDVDAQTLRVGQKLRLRQ